MQALQFSATGSLDIRYIAIAWLGKARASCGRGIG